ncbi:MAG TPA: type II toxin-antitoxin system VapB family antitoxin [Thermoanaerobaculia bacterium]|nr:type II toxin-antitoxin system VapB family antitoxin [Thermoanaerobaculia bacterium]
MRTNIVLDDELVEKALELTGARSKREVVQLALMELVDRRMTKSLLDLAGRVHFRRGYDIKSARELRRGSGR